MGNHELNAIHFHTNDPQTGTPLRPRTSRNLHQHKSFLNEFAPDAPATREVIDWMGTLPLYLDLEPQGFRAVHACWDVAAIARIRTIAPGGVLNEEQLIGASRQNDPLKNLLQTITKGPELPLPEGWSFKDKDGNERTRIRMKWWSGDGRDWADLAVSVPRHAVLPDTPPSPRIMQMLYPAAAKPVFFGHYWLSGKPFLQAPNALCLDYSAGGDGPLVTYLMEEGEELCLDNIRVHNR